LDVSVVIPTYNRYRLLRRAIASLQAQSFAPKEIIVVDDGSSDETAQIQQDFPEIIYIYQTNQGVSAARNRGIQEASSEWIAFLDSDDEWHKEKLHKQVAFHKNNPDILMSYTDEVWIRDGKRVNIPKKFQKIGKDAFVENIEYCNIAPSSVMMHRTLFTQVGFFDETLEVCEDYDLWLRVAHNHHIGLIREKFINKHAGESEQLGFKYWGMDRFRVKSLENLLEQGIETKYHAIVMQTLQAKYKLLLHGAKKYQKKEDIELFLKKLASL
jgi:glycosyltransferase involved in cell wall biosynthesis